MRARQSHQEAGQQGRGHTLQSKLLSRTRQTR